MQTTSARKQSKQLSITAVLLEASAPSTACACTVVARLSPCISQRSSQSVDQAQQLSSAFVSWCSTDMQKKSYWYTAMLQ